jgi:hypothetical protein
MLKISLFLFVAATAAAQTEIDDGGSVTLDSGVIVNLRTTAEPPMPRSAYPPLGVGFRSDGNTMRFIICDDSSASCFGFRLEVSAADRSGARVATFGPMGPEGAGMSVALENGAEFKQAPLPRYPAPQTIRDGGARIVEYLYFDFGTRTAESRDFTIDDGPAAFAFKPAGEVLVNGAKPSANAVFMDGHGRATVWVYLPGRGRYILSLVPHAGFVKAGVVRGAHMAFQADGQHFEVRLGRPLAGTHAPWNLYVLHDPRYVPLPGQAASVLVGADRLENLLPKITPARR